MSRSGLNYRNITRDGKPSPPVALDRAMPRAVYSVSPVTRPEPGEAATSPRKSATRAQTSPPVRGGTPEGLRKTSGMTISPSTPNGSPAFAAAPLRLASPTDTRSPTRRVVLVRRVKKPAGSAGATPVSVTDFPRVPAPQADAATPEDIGVNSSDEEPTATPLTPTRLADLAAASSSPTGADGGGLRTPRGSDKKQRLIRDVGRAVSGDVSRGGEDSPRGSLPRVRRGSVDSGTSRSASLSSAGMSFLRAKSSMFVKDHERRMRQMERQQQRQFAAYLKKTGQRKSAQQRSTPRNGTPPVKRRASGRSDVAETIESTIFEGSRSSARHTDSPTAYAPPESFASPTLAAPGAHHHEALYAPHNHVAHPPTLDVSHPTTMLQVAEHAHAHAHAHAHSPNAYAHVHGPHHSDSPVGHAPHEFPVNALHRLEVSPRPRAMSHSFSLSPSSFTNLDGAALPPQHNRSFLTLGMGWGDEAARARARALLDHDDDDAPASPGKDADASSSALADSKPALVNTAGTEMSADDMLNEGAAKHHHGHSPGSRSPRNVSRRTSMLQAYTSPTERRVRSTSKVTWDASVKAITEMRKTTPPGPGQEGEPPKRKLRITMAMLRVAIQLWRKDRAERQRQRDKHIMLMNNLRQHRIETAAATRIQASYRGHRVRSYLSAETLRPSRSRLQLRSQQLPTKLSYWEDPYDGASYMATIHAITPELLLTRLTHPDRDDQHLLELVALTHSLYMDSMTLLGWLNLRFLARPDVQKTQDHVRFKKNVEGPLQQRVLEVLRFWMDRYFYDFSDDRNVAAQADVLLTRWSHEATRPEVKETIRRTHDSLRLRLKVPQLEYALTTKTALSCPAPILPATSDPIQYLTDVSPVEVGRQLTLLDFAVFYQIRPREYLHQAWCKRGRELQSINVLAMIERFNDTAAWAAHEVLRRDNTEDRVHAICALVDVAETCLVLESFSSVMAIVSALQSASVSRLKVTWEALPREYEERKLKVFEAMNMQHNYSQYRALIKRATPPAVPYFGVHLQDLTFIDDGNPDHVGPLGNLINLDKHRMTAAVINDLCALRTVEYSLQPVDQIATFLHRNGEKLEESKLYALSLEREPRGLKMPKSWKKNKIIHEPPVIPPKPVPTSATNPAFVRALQARLTAETFAPGQYILRVGEMGHDMFFIATGFVQVIGSDGAITVMTAGEYFGVGAFYSLVQNAVPERRSYNVIAHSAVQCAVLPAEDCLEMLRQHPDVYAQVTALVESSAFQSGSRTSASDPQWFRDIARKVADDIISSASMRK